MQPATSIKYQELERRKTMSRRCRKFLFPLFVVTLTLFISAPGFSERPAGRKNTGSRLAKTAVSDLVTVDGNRIFNYLENNGQWCSFNNPIGFGMQWPGQNEISIIFAAGFWVGGKVNDSVRTAAAEFVSEFQPGNVKPDGAADDPTANRHQALKINKGDLLDEGFNNPDYGLWINDLYRLGAPIRRDENGNPILSATGKPIPEIIGDQMLWMVYNDFDAGLHASLHKSDPLGLEVQNTIWVFNRPDAFGDMMFLKFLLVNKGGNTVQDAFVGLWFDIDLGDANDDVVFCDTTLSLGAFWNDGDDQFYGANPPAVGADFFQGPIVPSPGDTANVSGRKIPGFKNLGMSSFAKYIRNGPVDAQDPTNFQEVYNFMLGLNGLGRAIIDPTTSQATKFVNVSDPEAGTGWIDGVDLAPADRRMLMNSGPFTLEPWSDTNGDGLAQVGEPGVQEVVAAILIAQGTSPRNSATRLKQADQLAQLAYDLNFALPPSPPTPSVTVHNLDREVVLSWDDAVESYVAVDEVDVDQEGHPTQYTFQGYNIYQADAPVVGPAVRLLKLATFDLQDGVGDVKDFVFSEEFGEVVEATVQKAPDTGVQRFFRVTADALGGGVPLSNWNKYWFVVTAYGYNPLGLPKILESPFTTIEVQPQQPAGGLRGRTTFGRLLAAINPDTTLNATHTSSVALSDGQLEVTVVDPSQITGRDYRVTFETEEATGNVTWNLDRLEGAETVRVLSGQTNQTGDNGYTIVDGIMAKIIGPPPGMKNWEITAGDRRWSSSQAVASFLNLEGFGNTIGMAFNHWFSSSTVAPASLRNVLIKFAGTDLDGNLLDPNDPDASFAYRYLRGAAAPPAKPEFAPFIKNPGEGYAFQEYAKSVPFAAFDVESNPPRRLMVGHLENNVAGGLVDGKYWPSDASLDNGAGTGPREWFFIFDVPYSETPDPSLQADILNTTLPIMWMGTPNRRGNVAFQAGDEFLINANHINTPNDVITFRTSGFEPVATLADAKAAALQVNLFPNPYFGQNRAEIDPVTRFVTITHLPANGVTIRIFTLAGDLIKTINDQVRNTQGTLGTQTALWNLRNDHDVPVASGIYLVHVDMGSLGQKVLKAAIFMPEERLDRF
jgi:hypothetical protein